MHNSHGFYSKLLLHIHYKKKSKRESTRETANGLGNHLNAHAGPTRQFNFCT